MSIVIIPKSLLMVSTILFKHDDLFYLNIHVAKVDLLVMIDQF